MNLTFEQKIALFMFCAFILIIAVLVLRRKLTYYQLMDKWLVDEFSRCNVIVFGKKGTGKDLLFAHVIWLRNEPHYANIQYTEATELFNLNELNLGNNTFFDVISGNINKLDRNIKVGQDVYISDGGVYLGCQNDKELDKAYPSMPMRFALSRQLDQNNIHVNVQALGRIWIKLREQADSFIWIRGSTFHQDYILVHTVCYDRYDSAVNFLLPQHGRKYKAAHGDITERVFKIYYGELDYDTFGFRDKFYK